MKWRRGELNPCPRRFPHKPLHAYPVLRFKESNVAPAHCRLPSVREIRFTGERGRSARRPACCPRFRRQQASHRKRRGQLSRESEIFVICVYLFWSGFYEANEPSSTCRLRFQPQVEASAPPFISPHKICGWSFIATAACHDRRKGARVGSR